MQLSDNELFLLTVEEMANDAEYIAKRIKLVDSIIEKFIEATPSKDHMVMFQNLFLEYIDSCLMDSAERNKRRIMQ